MNSNADRQVIAAHFSNPEAASEAIRQLRVAGFRSDQIGTTFESGEIEGRTFDTDRYGSDYSTHHRSFMDKMKNFFTGEEGYENRDTGAGDGTLNDGLRVGPTLRVPDSYNDRLTNGASLVTVQAGNRIDEAERILTECGGSIDREFIANDYEEQRGSDISTEGRRISMLSEVLRVNKQRVNTGEVRLRKEVRTENQTVEVPVTHEELVIERVETGERAATGETIGSDKEIRVPLAEEKVTVEKTPVVREEVRVGKRAVEETQRVTDDVRHEELDVEDTTGRVKGNVKGKNKKIA